MPFGAAALVLDQGRTPMDLAIAAVSKAIDSRGALCDAKAETASQGKHTRL